MDELEQGQSSMPPPPKPGTQSMPSASSMAALQSASSDPDGLLWLTGVLVFLSSLFAFLQNADGFSRHQSPRYTSHCDLSDLWRCGIVAAHAFVERRSSLTLLRFATVDVARLADT